MMRQCWSKTVHEHHKREHDYGWGVVGESRDGDGTEVVFCFVFVFVCVSPGRRLEGGCVAYFVQPKRV